MRCLLVLLLVTGARAFYEPGVDLDKYCRVCSDPVLRTYNAAYLMLLDEAKTTLSNFRDPYNPCKFSLRSVTSYDDHGFVDTLHVDWVGFGFDQHGNPRKGNGKNYIFGQSKTCIAIRGQGFSGPEVRILPFNYIGAVDNYVSYNPVSGAVELRSHTCQYALDWFPADFDTCLTFWIGDEFHNEANRNLLGGMCGTANNDLVDDFKKQDGTMVDMDIDGLWDIFYSWSDVKHPGGPFVGSERFELPCPPLP